MAYEEIPGYRAVHWEPLDLISNEAMNRMSANIQAVHDYTPRALYTVGDTVANDRNLRIASGRALIPKQKGNEANKTVKFRGFFSGGCHPNIAIGVNARLQQNIYCTFPGTQGAGLTPNNDGFIMHVQIAKEDGEKKKIARNIWVHWIAMGY